jgi:para-aminobenzoate synthetase
MSSPSQQSEWPLNQTLRPACTQLVAAIRRLRLAYDRPVVIALDGGSGSGKSMLAAMVAAQSEAAHIPVDDFFAADIPESQWPRFALEEKLQKVFHWQRLREEAILPLLAGRPAQWFPFDFASGQRADGTYGMLPDPVSREPKPVILLDGAYSAGPALSDLVDWAVLVHTPVKERHRRLAAREEKDFLARWHQLWDPLETYYFAQVRPPESFDYVVEND